MVRNIFLAVALFAGIGFLAFLLMQLPTTAPVPDVSPAPTQVDQGPVTLLPAGDFVPRYQLPAVRLQTEMPVVTLRYYQVRDRALLLRLFRGFEQDSLSGVALARLLTERDVPFMTQTVVPQKGAAKLDWPAPLGTESGLYVVTAARDAMAPAVAATWFLRTDLQLVALEEKKTWQVVCQNMVNGQAAAQTKLEWHGVGAVSLLGETSCDASGHASLDKALLPANAVPQWLVGQGEAGDVTLVPLCARCVWVRAMLPVVFW